MKEDKSLKERLGKESPFKVPENYFESLIPEIMDKLPENKFQESIEINLWERVKPWVYMVAMFCGLMFSIRVIVGDNYKEEKSESDMVSPLSEKTEDFQEEYINGIANDVMMDDYTLYLYLTDNSNGIYE